MILAASTIRMDSYSLFDSLLAGTSFAHYAPNGPAHIQVLQKLSSGLEQFVVMNGTATSPLLSLVLDCKGVIGVCSQCDMGFEERA